MKIRVTTERDCCQPEDLKPVELTKRWGNIPDMMFCVHCGRRHQHESFTDAAGSRDWHYVPLPLPEEQDSNP